MAYGGIEVNIVFCFFVIIMLLLLLCFFFFFNDTATTEIYTLSLHDALPILIMRNDNRNINVVKPCIGHLIGLPYNELSSKKSLTVAFLTVVILPIRNDNSSQLKDVCLKLINVRPTFFYTDRKSTRLNSSH